MRLLAAAAGALLLGAGPAGAVVAPAQQLAEVFGPQRIHAGPSASSPVVADVESTRPITGARTTLPVLGRAADPGGRPWLRVRLPGRVLGRDAPPATGWIRAAATLPSITRWHLVVDRAARTVSAFRAGERVRRFRAIVGAPSTPTPAGSFFVEENVRLARRYVGAPFALAASARSEVLQEFAGGPGQIALHGRGRVGGTLGTAVSAGCVRLSRRAITWLADRIGPGVPLTIR